MTNLAECEIKLSEVLSWLILLSIYLDRLRDITKNILSQKASGRRNSILGQNMKQERIHITGYFRVYTMKLLIPSHFVIFLSFFYSG
jgi:hypothetical protein